jgi:hypothetical protein
MDALMQENRQVFVLLAVSLVGLGAVTSAVGVVAAQAAEQEPNDEFETAQQVVEGTVTGEAVGGESDFYRLEANTTDALDLEISERDGDVRLRLYDPERSVLVDDGFNTRDVTLKAPRDGTYYIEVVGDGDRKSVV